MDELLGEFLTETNESLSLLDGEIVKLEKDPNDSELIAQIFRLVHTIKGTCGFLSLDRLEKVAHAGENVLGKLRDKELTATPDIVSVILSSLDRIKEILSVLEETEKEPTGDDTSLINELNAIADGKADIAPEAEEATIEPVQEAEIAPQDDTENAEVAEIIPVQSKEADKKPEMETPQDKATTQDNQGIKKESTIAAQSIRVNVDLLDKLMTLVSELVLTRNQMIQISRRVEGSEYNVPLQHINHVTSELQESVMKTRMQPIGNAWAKLPRMVRDLSHELGKNIDLQMLGAETELDRQVLELIKDPLTHMVRNAADHGIEDIQARQVAGKADAGRIILEAFHEGGHIIIKIQDDGKGLDIEKIKSKVLTNGLATEAELETLSDQQIQQFIFKPGFSTAAQVTSVSGRGVGMDVVRTNIEKIGGTIEFNSVLGKGSTFTIKIPLTLAIVSALIVKCGDERFAIPQLNVLELVRASKQSDYQIETINDAPVLRLRDRLLPLLNLKSTLKIETTQEEAEEQTPEEATEKDKNEGFIIVTQVGAHNFGVVVDQVYDTEEIVVKPVSPMLRHLSVFSGNTILGDGSVVLILDPNGLAEASGVTVTKRDMREVETTQDAESSQKIDLLLFKAGSDNLKAVPLSLVARLEDIDVSKIEHKDTDRPLIQYRGKLMPITSISGNINVKEEGTQPILVFADHDRHAGIIVDEIVDIVKDNMVIQVEENQNGVVGSAIIAGKATDIVDVGFYLTRIFPDWFSVKVNRNAKNNKNKNVLLVDDSQFFRNLLIPVLTSAGYNVTAAENGPEALAYHDEGKTDFDVIITDIEMPQMSGFELAEEIRQKEKWKDKPIIALSAFTSEDNFERGKDVGIQNYIAKLDRDTLIHAISDLVA